jgi:serine/threonine protein kinase
MAFDTLYALDATPFDKGKEGVSVFGAKRLADGARVAVKVFTLPTLPKREAEMREAIDKEFAVREMLKQRAAPLADHPHLVPSLGLFYVEPPPARKGGDPVRAMLVMGLARGKSAEHRLGGGTFDVAGGSAHGGGEGGGGGGIGGGGGGVDPLFSPAETVSVAYCLASALAHLHAHGALHYDVKPANTLFLDGDHVPPRARSACLADFGEARITRGGTTTGGKRGTDAFMAPEVSIHFQPTTDPAFHKDALNLTSLLFYFFPA